MFGGTVISQNAETLVDGRARENVRLDLRYAEGKGWIDHSLRYVCFFLLHGRPGCAMHISIREEGDGNVVVNMAGAESDGFPEILPFSGKRQRDMEKHFKDSGVDAVEVSVDASGLRASIRLPRHRANAVMHSVAGFLPYRLLHGLFQNHPLDERETAFLKAFVKAGSEREAAEAVDRFIRDSGLERELEEAILLRFLEIGRRSSIRKAREQEKEMEENLRRAEEARRKAFEAYRNASALRYGLESGDGIGSERYAELADLFHSNRALVLLQSSPEEGTLHFGVRTVANQFDPAAARRILNRLNPERGRLVQSLFIDESAKLRLCARFKLNLEIGDVQPLGMKYGKGWEWADGYLPNQHLTRYGCMGDYMQDIAEAAKHGDWAQTVYTCILSTGNVNLSDRVPTDSMLDCLLSGYYRYPVLEAGGVAVTPESFLKAEEKREKDGEEA